MRRVVELLQPAFCGRDVAQRWQTEHTRKTRALVLLSDSPFRSNPNAFTTNPLRATPPIRAVRTQRPAAGLARVHLSATCNEASRSALDFSNVAFATAPRYVLNDVRMPIAVSSLSSVVLRNVKRSSARGAW